MTALAGGAAATVDASRERRRLRSLRGPRAPSDARRQWPLPKQADPDAPLLEVDDLTVHFSLPNGRVKAVVGSASP